MKNKDISDDFQWWAELYMIYVYDLKMIQKLSVHDTNINIQNTLSSKCGDSNLARNNKKKKIQYAISHLLVFYLYCPIHSYTSFQVFQDFITILHIFPVYIDG